jgi:hypothetical protein
VKKKVQKRLMRMVAFLLRIFWVTVMRMIEKKRKYKKLQTRKRMRPLGL